MKKSYFKKGEWNVICDMCGLEYKSGQMRKNSDELYVCKPCFEKQHPQEFLRGRPDRQTVPWTRPDTDEADVSANTVAFIASATDTADTPEANEYLGWRVAIDTDGNTAVASTHRNDVGAVPDAGGAIVFVRDGITWSQQQRIENTYSSTTGQMGQGLDISGDGNTIALGTPYDDEVVQDNGMVQVWTRSGDTWSLEQTITNPDATATLAYFGYDLSISKDGNTLLVGAYGMANGATAGAGRGYVFTRSGGVWSLSGTLTKASPSVNDLMGFSVALSGDGNTAWLGAPYESTNTGFVTEFNLVSGTWTEGQTLQATSPTTNEYFGWWIDLNYDGTWGIIGASGTVVDGITQAGVAEMWKNTSGTWARNSVISHPDPAFQDYFGVHVAIDDDGSTALICASGDDVHNTEAGATYEYSRTDDTWSLKRIMDRSTLYTVGTDEYGGRCDISRNGSYAIVSAQDAHVDSTDEGRVTFWNK